MTYTDKEIKKWFEEMKKKYPNSNLYYHLASIEFLMFDNFHKKDNLERVKNENDWS